MPESFKLRSRFEPAGDQPDAIAQLAAGLERGERHQTLLGITGSGKTFTIANVIARVNRPALIMAPNKTLAAQLYSEMRELFPDNAVEYFVSYYDYYQPEAYIPTSDTYIEKDSILNERIDRLRHMLHLVTPVPPNPLPPWERAASGEAASWVRGTGDRSQGPPHPRLRRDLSHQGER